MGVPAFFRWLCSRNPKALWDVRENPDDYESASLNPQVDNLYLDMNGIIHPCSHPEVSGIPIPLTIHDMFVNVFNYVDRLVELVRPQRVLYMAIDGVAPRAKMNQQRARRFRAAQEAERIYMEKKRLREEWANKGVINPLVDQYIDGTFDSNQITPGTEFMQDLSIALQYYVYERLNNHPLWKNLVVVFSDASVPGEGEHKVLQYIREQRNLPDYNPNTRHCIYGADADLIMLALSTHEPWFYIIRETIMTGEDKFCTRCQQRGHFFTECANREDEETEVNTHPRIRTICVNFQMIKIHVVREWLWLEMSELSKHQLKFQLDLERIIDDFIFLCFLVGNDFLPHIPALRITEGGIDCLMILYMQTVPKAQDYLTNCGSINLPVLDVFLQMLGVVEEHLLRGQQKKMDIIKQRNQQGNGNHQGNHQGRVSEQKDSPSKLITGTNENILDNFKKVMKDKIKEVNQCEMSAAQVLQQTDPLPQWQFLSLRQRYYTEKFHIEAKNFPQFRDRLRLNYVEALQWTLGYYYKGCMDWGWFYQFHYAPFAQDVVGCSSLILHFHNEIPFLPFQQLLAVLPERSKQFLPSIFHSLMTPDSPIADFYPSDFFVDLKGKKFAWLGEVVLPFVDAHRLVEVHDQAINQYTLSRPETLRNKRGNEQVFYRSECTPTLSGMVLQPNHRFPLESTIGSPLPTFPDIKNNQVVSQFIMSACANVHRQIQNALLPGCVQPQLEMDVQYQKEIEGSKSQFSGIAVRRILSNVLSIPFQEQSRSYHHQHHDKRRGMDLAQMDQLRKYTKH